MSHCIVVGYALFIATFSVGLWYAGISMGYLYGKFTPLPSPLHNRSGPY
jgi:hypothetical protein